MKKLLGLAILCSAALILSMGNTGCTNKPAPPKKDAPAKAEAPKQEAEAAAAKLPAGYADMTIADINKSVGDWSAEEIEAALEYEGAHANRKGAIAALEARKDG